MRLKDTITRLNIAIAQGVRRGSFQAYGITEKMSNGNTYYLSNEGQHVGIDDSFDAVLWHRVLGSNIGLYTGRGANDSQLVNYRINLICYSKKLDFCNYLLAKIASNNTLKLIGSNLDKEAVIKRELPESLRNFDIEHYLFSISYEAKEIIDPNCLTDFCF